MYRIVIADDEPFIIKGLKVMVDWESIGAEIVGEAENGRQLMDLIETLKPDIVISDIEMPELKGLDVIRFVQERKLKTKVLLLSAYQEFSYAKDAITYGALDYMVKPVSKEELTLAIKRAMESIDKEKASINLKENLNEKTDKQMERSGELSCEHITRKLEEQGGGLQNKVYAGICFSLSEESTKTISNHNKFELLRFAIFKSIQDYLEVQKLGIVVKRSDKYSNAILVLPIENCKMVLMDKIKDLRNVLFRQYEARINIGIGDFTKQLDKVNYLYKTAKFSAELYYFKRDDTIFYDTINKEYHHSLEELDVLVQNFLEAVIHRDKDWIKRGSECFELIENIHYGNRYATENKVNVILTDLSRFLKEYKMIGEMEEKELEGLTQKIRFQATFVQLQHYIFKNLESILEKIYSAPENKEALVIGQAKKYIKEHFAEEISLEQIAGMVYMNRYYFSTFFKKETGQNFKKYLLEVRMAEAKKLLLEGNMKTYEIAEAVGYKDVRSFSDKFKEVYGETTSNFKKNE